MREQKPLGQSKRFAEFTKGDLEVRLFKRLTRFPTANKLSNWREGFSRQIRERLRLGTANPSRDTLPFSFTYLGRLPGPPSTDYGISACQGTGVNVILVRTDSCQQNGQPRERELRQQMRLATTIA